MGAVTRMQIEKLANWNEVDPGMFEGICADISNGATVDEAYARLTNEYDVSWGALRTWIRADEVREARYQEALSARLELRREKAAANVAKIAQVGHGKERVTVGDTLKAAGIVLDRGEGEGGVAVSIKIVHESA